MPFSYALPALGLLSSMNSADNAQSNAENSLAAQKSAGDQQAKLGQDQLDFNKQVYADGAGARTQGMQIAGDVSKAQLASMDQQNQIAAEYNEYNKGTFRPLEQKIVGDAQGYDTAGRRADAIAGATSDVEQGYASANDSNNRALQRMGVTPGSGRMQSMMADQTIAKANAIAGATTGAVRNVETVGAARMADAANLGRNLPSNQAVAANSAITAGNSAANSGMQGVAAQQSGIGNVNNGYQGAISGGASAGNLYGQAANSYNNMATANAGAMGSFGSAIGKAGGNGAFNGMTGTLGSMFNGSYNANYGNEGRNSGGYVGSPGGSNNYDAYDLQSDENIKSDTDTPLDTKKALDGIVNTPVKTGWKYDPAKGGPDDGMQPHDGPMAQAVERHMGRDVAPGGKKIDVASMNGRMLGGMQEIVRRIKKLEAKGA